jgi:hypothetical protein
MKIPPFEKLVVFPLSLKGSMHKPGASPREVRINRVFRLMVLKRDFWQEEHKIFIFRLSALQADILLFTFLLGAMPQVLCS